MRAKSVAAQLRRLGHDSDVLNNLVEDRKRLTLDEREAIAALQTWAMSAAQLLDPLPEGG